MKKKIKFLSIISIILFFILSVITFFNSDLSVSNISRKSKTKPDLSIAILGDVHSKTDRLKSAAKDLYGINSKIDALVLNGDTVDQGLDNQYKSVKRTLLLNSWYFPNQMFINIGNHEFYDYEKGENSPEEVQKFVKRYLEFADRDKVYTDSWIKGYHLIFLGSEQCYTPELGSTQAYLSSEQLEWFKEKLAEQYTPGRPILVFLHQHLSGESNSSQFRWVGVKQDAELKQILSKYKEVVIFTSHTHSSLSLSNKYIKEPFTAVHTGPITNPIESDGKGGRKSVEGSQGLYVEITGNEVFVRGRDFKNKTWIDEAVSTINE
jgi:3',5'-cyclic-AMP phosphodiesterase